MDHPLITYHNGKAISKEIIEKDNEDLQRNDMYHICTWR
jgi:hypothetical protein